MKHHFHFLLLAIAFFAVVLTQSSCRENTLIRSKVLPANDTVGVRTYTLSCVTHTYYDDTAITSTDIGGIPSYQGVGVFNDPFFGTMTGATYFQLLATDMYNVFAGNIIDSAILVLPYSGFTYGDSTNQTLTQSYQVFSMLDTLGNPYYTNYFNFTTKPIDITDPLSDPVTVNLYQLKDSFGYNQVAANTPGLRIKLHLPALLKTLIPALNIAATSTNLPTDFFNSFLGICVMPANTQVGSTAIPYFQLNNTSANPNNYYNQAGILVYYHAPGAILAPGDSSLPEVLYFDPGSCSHFNNITRSYSRYPINSLLHSTLANDSIIVLQNQPGASFDVLIKGIRSLPAGIINNAQLQITVLSNYTPDSTELPERLYPIGIGSATYPNGVGNGVVYELADRYPTGSITPIGYMDGFYHYINSSIRTYTINIPREVMASIAAKNDTIHMHINGTQDFYGAFKMIAGGGSYRDSLYQPKLIVVYSKLNN